ncbi:MAG TPA: ATP-binding protein [Pyrinomonadaceae bacterium]|nr:ATP-binding protein [Pyrinomonadaceae bacterium]
MISPYKLSQFKQRLGRWLPRLTLERRVLLLAAVSMLLILAASFYLYSVRTSAVIHQDHYDNAVSQTLVLSDRISKHNYFSSLEDLNQEMELVESSRPDFKQIDVYENTANGPQLLASTAPSALRLSTLIADEKGKSQQLQPGVVSSEITLNNNDYWLINAPIKNSESSGYLLSLVFKGSRRNLASSLRREYNLVLLAAVISAVAVLYLLFQYFFRHPVREILHAMDRARSGQLSSRATVHRDDELGAVADNFNRLMDEISTRSREREDLLSQIRSLNQDLENKVDIATQELKATNADLIRTQRRLADAERMAAIGQVTASLAHEIGTPLNAVVGHLQLLGREHRDTPETQRRLKTINGQLDAVIQTVRSLLERARRPKSTVESTDLNEMIRDVMQLIRPALEIRNIQASAFLEPRLPVCLADRNGLRQVLLNLANNSCDAMPGGGRIEITTRCLSEHQRVEILFADSGPGISPDVTERLFEPWFTTKESGGGLGLVIAQEIMTEQRGTIELVSGSIGAVFSLTLPLAQVVEVPDRAEVQASAA